MLQTREGDPGRGPPHWNPSAVVRQYCVLEVTTVKPNDREQLPLQRRHTRGSPSCCPIPSCPCPLSLLNKGYTEFARLAWGDNRGKGTSSNSWLSNRCRQGALRHMVYLSVLTDPIWVHTVIISKYIKSNFHWIENRGALSESRPLH